MKKVCGIYKIQSKCKPERIYIGSSSNINRRWIVHRTTLKTNKNQSHKLQRHVNKYGLMDLEFSIIEQFDFVSKEMLLEREQYYLTLLKPWFNISPTAVSTLGCKRSAESKEKYRNARLGKRASAETRKKQSKAKKGIIPWNRGIPRTEECKRKISETKLQGRLSQKQEAAMKLKRRVLQFDLEGNLVRKWDNIYQAALGLGFRYKTISERCRIHPNIPYRGFYFKIIFERNINK